MRTFCIISLSALLTGLPLCADSTATSPVISIVVDHPILTIHDPNDTPATTAMHVESTGFPAGDPLSFSWKQVQDVYSPIAAKRDDGKLIEFSKPNSSATGATFPDWGVYEVTATVTDIRSKISAYRHVWISVWDKSSHILKDGHPDPLFEAPAIEPPTSVRTLSPDPGPFQHPRLYATDSDWSEITKRCSEQSIAAAGLKTLRNVVQDGVESAGSPEGKLVAALQSYGDSKYADAQPDLTMGTPAEEKDGKPDWSRAYQQLINVYSQLEMEALASWLSIDPSTPPGQVDTAVRNNARKWCTVLAAVCHLQLTKSLDLETGTFHRDYPLYIQGLDAYQNNNYIFPQFREVALAYDFLYKWMTTQEASEIRNFLFAASAGRTTGARNELDFENGVLQDRGGVERGMQQNGDFMNIDEEKILSQLVLDGEDSAVDPRLIKLFITGIPKPKDFDTSGKCCAYEWVQSVDSDSGRKTITSGPYPEGGNWPFARKVEVDNLQRMINWSEDWYMSPWGFGINRMAYYGFSAAGLWPASVAYARHGAFNNFVAGSYYITILHHLYSYYPGLLPAKSAHFATNYYLYDHHDGGTCRSQYPLILKYMYPDDPAVDMVYQPYAVDIEARVREPVLTVLFGMDPGINQKLTTMPKMAAEKQLPLTKVDPQVGVVVARSGWNDDDMMLYFDVGWQHTGHMHAEKNSFSFFALGRPWTISPGYHVNLSGQQAAVMIQDPDWAKDPLTEGYIGESPSLVPEGSPYPHCFPTPPGHLLEITETPDKAAVIMAGDAKTAYDFGYVNRQGEGSPAIISPWTREQFMYPGFEDEFLSRVNNALSRRHLTTPHNNIGWDEKISPNYNPVLYAFRTILFVRGKDPYMMVVDDINKDGKPRNYRWTMGNSFNFGAPDGRFADEKGNPVTASMIVAANPTATQCTLLHLPDQGDAEGLPRLLVRDLSEQANDSQPPMSINTQQTGEEHDHPVIGDRLFIDRNNVVEPKYKLLFFPYRTGQNLPKTTWNLKKTELLIQLPDGTNDVIGFDNSNPDHRTRLQFQRRK